MNLFAQPASRLLHADDSLVAYFMRHTKSVRVWFANEPAIHLPIKHAMKKSAMIKIKPAATSLFQVAAHMDDSLIAAGKSAAALQKKPLADLMLHPEKVAAVLAVTKNANQVAGPSPVRQEPQTKTPKQRGGGHQAKTARSSLVKTKFHFAAPTAKVVKLAADFTDWEKSPLALTRSVDGAWQAVVPLPRGEHAYRFIVDGQWCDDPHPGRKHIANPFGTQNAIITVA